MRNNVKFILERTGRLVRILLLVFGIMMTFFVLLAFTTLPFWMYHGLGTKNARYDFAPERIIVLGGSGMPSESNLIRCYKAAELGIRYPKASVVIALPKDSAENLYQSAVYGMKKELVLRGIDSSRIQLETNGRNTRSQALAISKLTGTQRPTVLVTSPEHMYRSILTFRKAGMLLLGGEAAFERALDSELSLQQDQLGGRSIPLSGAGDELQLRYQFWNHLKYQLLCYREYAAIAYYRLKDWL